ncbi:MAG: CDP-archaeol synthase [Candidatus Binatia bacterium]
MYPILQILYFFIPAYVGNMAPVLVRNWFAVLAQPIDGGRTLWGRPLLGDHKTWRGLLSGTITGILAYEGQRWAYMCGVAHELALVDYAAYPLLPGFLMGLGAGVGDAIKSFCKRRLGIAPGATWLVFDQLDFVVGAYLSVSIIYAPPLLPMVLSLPVMFVGNVGSTIIGFWLGFKESWV